MPRKGREKGGQSPREKKKKTAAVTGTEAMPQVWLPDQPDTEGGGGFSILPPKEEGPPPTDEEQRHMAQFWAEEEHQSPRGWDDEEELDYSEVVRKREEREEREESESRDQETVAVSTPDLFKYAQSTVFTVRSLGRLGNIPPSLSTTNSHSPNPPTTTVAIIDRAQKQGLLPWVTSDSDQCLFSVSKYGVKVTDPQKQRVHCRHPLHHIVTLTHYTDTYNKHMIAVRVSGGRRETGVQQELFVYEAEDEAQAGDICLTMDQAFKTVHSNLLLQQNLTSDLR